MNWKLVKKEKEKKEILQVYVYSETIARLKEIAETENVKLSHVVRHALNTLIEAYAENSGKGEA